MNQISLDSAEMRMFLEHIISNNRVIQEQGKTPVSTEIIGESGLGKTSIATQMAKELNLNFVKLNLAQIEELGDLVGFPIRQFELSKSDDAPKFKIVKDENGKAKKVKVASGSAVWVDENATDDYISRGYKFTGNKRMSYCPPEWIADKQGGGILLLDDWNRADIRFIQAVMELVDRQEYISWKLPKDWHILLTANPDNGEYLVQSIDTAQRTRFVSTVLKWNHERWAEWAETTGIDGRCINFVLMNPEIVNARVNPRSLTTFFNCISSLGDFNKSLPMIQMIGEGSVGPETATLFTSFINNRLDQLITPKDMLFRSDSKSVMNQLSDCINPNNDYRADIASVLATRMINYALHYAESNPVTQDTIERIQNIIKEEIFTNDLQYIIVKRLLAGNKTKFQKLIIDPVIQEIATK